jgi:creatinine amidohydrolase
MGRFAKLRDMGVHSGMWWYADYPENIVGWPSLATREKGEQLLEAYGKDFAVVLKAIKEDTVLPQLQQEFYKRHAAVRNNK